MRSVGNNVRISGCDLVYPIAKTVIQSDSFLFAMIPSNPCYWKGTRIAQVAPAYMNFRPISMTFSYIPQVAVTQQGTVFMGTLWNASSPYDDLQQSLFTSNGGCMTQCYVPCDTRIQLGSNLQQNLFTTYGEINSNTSPFLFMAGVAGADVVPGYFYVSYVFDFKNPIGSALKYVRDYTTVIDALTKSIVHGNNSIVILQGTKNYGPGTVFDVEFDIHTDPIDPTLRMGSAKETRVPTIYYHGTRVTLPSQLPVVLLSNEQYTEPPDLYPGQDEEEEEPEPEPQPDGYGLLDNAKFTSSSSSQTSVVLWNAIPASSQITDLNNEIVSYYRYTDNVRVIAWLQTSQPTSYIGKAFYRLLSPVDFSAYDTCLLGANKGDYTESVPQGSTIIMNSRNRVSDIPDSPGEILHASTVTLIDPAGVKSPYSSFSWGVLNPGAINPTGYRCILYFTGLNQWVLGGSYAEFPPNITDLPRWYLKVGTNDVISEFKDYKTIRFSFQDSTTVLDFTVASPSLTTGYNSMDIGQWALLQ